MNDLWIMIFGMASGAVGFSLIRDLYYSKVNEEDIPVFKYNTEVESNSGRRGRVLNQWQKWAFHPKEEFKIKWDDGDIEICHWTELKKFFHNGNWFERKFFFKGGPL